MECINKMEIQGIIGTIRLHKIFDKSVANMSVATDMVYKNNSGDMVAETTWHNLVVWEDNTSADLNKLERGMHIHAVGRVRNTKYTSASGEERVFTEIIANEFKVIE